MKAGKKTRKKRENEPPLLVQILPECWQLVFFFAHMRFFAFFFLFLFLFFYLSLSLSKLSTLYRMGEMKSFVREEGTRNAVGAHKFNDF